MEAQELQDVVTRLSQVQRYFTDLMALAQYAVHAQYNQAAQEERLAMLGSQVETLEGTKSDLQREVRQLQADMERLTLKRQEDIAAYQIELTNARAMQAVALEALDAERQEKLRVVERETQAYEARLQALRDAEQMQEAALERARAAFREAAVGIGA